MILATQKNNRLFRLRMEYTRESGALPDEILIHTEDKTLYLTSPQAVINAVLDMASHTWVHIVDVMIWNPDPRMTPQTTYFEQHTQGGWHFIANGFTNHIHHKLADWVELYSTQPEPLTLEEQVIFYHTFLNNALAPWLGLS